MMTLKVSSARHLSALQLRRPNLSFLLAATLLLAANQVKAAGYSGGGRSSSFSSSSRSFSSSSSSNSTSPRSSSYSGSSSGSSSVSNGSVGGSSGSRSIWPSMSGGSSSKGSTGNSGLSGSGGSTSGSTTSTKQSSNDAYRQKWQKAYGVGTGVAVGAAAGVAAGSASAASPGTSSSTTNTNANASSKTSSFAAPTTVKTHKDGGRTEIYSDGSKITFDSKGNPRGALGFNGNNEKVYTDIRTGTRITYQKDGTQVVSKANGTNQWVETLTNGQQKFTRQDSYGHRNEYYRQPEHFGRSNFHYYQPSAPQGSSSFGGDNVWFWMWLLSHNSNAGAHTVIPPSVATSGGAGSNSTGNSASPAAPSQPAPPQHFSYDWTRIFNNLPEGLPTVKEYKDGLSWMVDYVIMEIIDENTERRVEKAEREDSDSLFAWWDRSKEAIENKTEEENDSDKKEVVAAYQMDSSMKGPMAKQIIKIIESMQQQKPFTIKDMVDLKTGELLPGDFKPVFLVNENLETNDFNTEALCHLESGSGIALKSVNLELEKNAATAEVLQSIGSGDLCEEGKTIRVDLEALQAYQDELAQRVERAMSKIIGERQHFKPVQERFR